MSAEIIQFVPRGNRRRTLPDFTPATRSPFRTDDLTMGHADTAPCEYVSFGSEPGGEDERK